MKTKILKHGFIKLIDHMGSDVSIEMAARQSYDENPESRASTGGTRKLLRYLMRHRHTSPFEMAELVFQVRAPIFVFRQWHRHRTASINEISGRYSQLAEEFYVPENYLKQSTDNKQGSSNEVISENDYLKRYTENLGSHCFDHYNAFIKEGCSKEQARMHLPLSTFSTMTWKCNLHNLFHFLKLRLDHHAQYEIRVYAEEIAKIVKELFPISYEAFEDYVLNAVTFFPHELKLLKDIFDCSTLCPHDLAYEQLKGRELEEFKKKLFKIVAK